MIRCYCCERRIGHSIEDCDCVPDYCDRCLACETHCTCQPKPVTVPHDLDCRETDATIS